jgi:hypothetical protein
MKKLIYTLGLFVALSTSGFAQEHSANDGHNHGATAQDPTSQAEIKFDKTEHDYGNITQGDNGECVFKFKNTGKEPLIITNCQGSCGCTVPACPKDPILPGKTGEIKVKYDTQRVGPINKTVSVTSNAKNGTQTISIKGNIAAKPVEEAFPASQPSQGAPLEKK